MPMTLTKQVYCFNHHSTVLTCKGIEKRTSDYTSILENVIPVFGYSSAVCILHCKRERERKERARERERDI